MCPQLYVWPRMSDTTTKEKELKVNVTPSLLWIENTQPGTQGQHTISRMCTSHTHEELTIPHITQSSSQDLVLS